MLVASQLLGRREKKPHSSSSPSRAGSSGLRRTLLGKERSSSSSLSLTCDASQHLLTSTRPVGRAKSQQPGGRGVSLGWLPARCLWLLALPRLLQSRGDCARASAVPALPALSCSQLRTPPPSPAAALQNQSPAAPRYTSAAQTSRGKQQISAQTPKATSTAKRPREGPGTKAPQCPRGGTQDKQGSWAAQLLGLARETETWESAPGWEGDISLLSHTQKSPTSLNTNPPPPNRTH